MKNIDLGCGRNPYPNSLRVDAIKYNGIVDLQLDITKDKLPVGPFDYVHCSHLLEYLTYTEANKLLKNIYRITANKGYVRISVPDISYYITAGSHLKTSKFYEAVRDITCGKQEHPYDIIKSIYTIQILETMIKDAVPDFMIVDKTHSMYNVYNNNGDIQFILRKIRS